MSAYLSIVSKRTGAEDLVLVDGPPFTSWILIGKDLGSPSWQHSFSAARGTQGRRASSATPDDRQIVFGLLSDDNASKDALASDLSTLAGVIGEMRRFGGYVTWREHDQTYQQTAEVLVAGASIGSWDSQEFDSRNAVRPTLTFTVAPYLLGDPCDYTDDFSEDRVTGGEDYDDDAGVAATDLAVTCGSLFGAGTLTSERRIALTARGYTHHDMEATLQYMPGTTLNGFKAGVMLLRLDNQNYLTVYVDDNGTNSRLRIDKVVAGSTTNLASTNLGARVIDSRAAWMRGRIEGGVVYAEHFLDTNVPTPTVTPTTSTSFTFTSAETAVFGTTVEGLGGIVFTPQHADANLMHFEFHPWTYRNPPPYVLDLHGDIPGDAPALADVRMAAPSGLSTVAWAMFAWEARASVQNMCQWGDFERAGTTGWSAAGVSGVTGAATSITATVDGTLAYGAKYGEYAAVVVCPATANTGVAYAIYKRFRAGVTYTARAWVRAPSATTNVRIRLGVSGDIASSTAAALNDEWNERTITWTPTAAVDVAYFAAEITAATGTTFHLDGVSVYEGTTAPSVGRQIEGQGANPLLAVIRAEEPLSDGAINLTRNSDGTANGGFAMTDTVGAPGETYAAGYALDPELSLPGDYSQGSARIEVWARIKVSAAFTGGLTMNPYLTAEAGTATIYTSEFGGEGKTVVMPSSGNDKWRMVRLGTFDLGTATNASGRWLLFPQATVAAGTNSQTFAMDDIWVVPERSRWLLPTGKARSASAGYPDFLPQSSSLYRVVRSDLTSTIRKSWTEGSAGGVNGSMIELPTGPINVLAMGSSEEPDDSVAHSNSETQGFTSLHLSVRPRYHWLRS